MKKLPFDFSVVAQATKPDNASITIRGIIGYKLNKETWTITDTEEAVLNELNKIPKGKKIDVFVNSKGGDVGLALGIYNALASRSADITTHNRGYAASAGSIVMLAGSRRVSPLASNWMIHEGRCGAYGTVSDLRAAANMGESINKTMCSLYAKAMGKPESEVAGMMAKETWFTGPESKVAGLATDESSDAIELEDPEKLDEDEVEAIANFKNPPDSLKDLQTRLVTARAQATAIPPLPPTPQTTPTNKKSMKNIITALVAAGFTIPADADENQLLPHVQSLISERANLKAENQKHLDARTTRVTALIDLAVTDKVLADTRKPGLIALGAASAEGETEVAAQLTELRAAHATKAPRGAKPALAGAGDSADEAFQIEARLEEIETQLDDVKTTPQARSILVRESLKLKGMDALFIPAQNARQN